MLVGVFVGVGVLQTTVMLAVDVLFSRTSSSSVVVTTAVLSMRGQLASVVSPLTENSPRRRTTEIADGPKVAGKRASTRVDAAHAAATASAPLTVHVTPAGKTSVRMTSLIGNGAVVTTIVKLATSPASIGVASATFSTWTLSKTCAVTVEDGR